MSHTAEEATSDPQWYYRARGKDWGPLSTDGLLELVERGRLSRRDQVKLGEEGEWMLAGDVEGLCSSDATDTTRAASDILAGRYRTMLGPADEEDSGEPSWRRIFPALGRGLGLSWFRDVVVGLTAAGRDSVGRLVFHRATLSVVALAALVLIGRVFAPQIAWIWRPSANQDAQEMLTALAEEFKDNRQRGATPAQWQDLAERSQRELAPLLEELAQTAGPGDRTALWLVQAGRDFWPRMLEDAREDSFPSANEGYFERRLQHAQMSEQQRHEQWLVVGIFGADAVVVAGLAVWWWKR